MHIHFRFMAPRLMDIRTRLPAQALSRQPGLTISFGLEPNLGALGLDVPKALVHQRLETDDETAWLRSTARIIGKGWLSILELDDHPQAFADLLGYRLTEASWRHLGHFHAIQTSTERLAEAFAPWNPNVAVFPNAVFDLPPLVTRARPPKIFYGAIYRGKLAVEMMTSLSEVLSRHPEVEVVVIGDRPVFDATPTANKAFHDYLPFDDYQRLMRSCDICLTPLGNSVWERCKSDAKFLDAAQNSVVMVASEPVYGETIVDGETGFIARTIQDWPVIVKRLIEEPDTRSRVSAAAWEYVKANRLFSYQGPMWRDWYRQLWSRRDELNRELLDRAPALKAIFQANAPGKPT